MSENRNKSVGGLVISEEVIAKMVSAAALEVAGVDRLVPRSSDLKGLFHKDKTAGAVHVKVTDSEIVIDVNLGLKHGVRITDVCEEAQKNIKNTVQNMTGRAVAKVNINVVDVALPVSEE